MKIYSILLKKNTRVDVKARNIYEAYEKLADVGNYAWDITATFLEYDENGIQKTEWMATKESIAAWEKFVKPRKIKFDKEFKESMLNGRKTYTTRRKKKLNGGDIFKAFGEIFLTTNTIELPIEDVLENYWDEGFNSREEFHEKLKQYYGGELPEKLWVHRFAKM